MRSLSHLLENCVREHGVGSGRALDDDYALDRGAPLGQGAYGRVLRATRRASGAPVAVKQLPLARATARAARRRSAGR